MFTVLLFTKDNQRTRVLSQVWNLESLGFWGKLSDF